MKLKNIYWLSLLGVLLVLAGCKDNGTVDPPPPPEPPLPELTAPKDLVVSVRQAKKVVVEWVGDETATSYEVEMAGQNVQLEGTSCGMYVKQNTDYTWKVRAIRGEDVTEWVTGPPFKTLTYDDPRIDWIGYWGVGDWKLEVDISGTPVSLDELMDLIPEDLINAIKDAIEFKLAAPEQESEIPDYDELIITFDLLEELELPEVASVFIHDKMFSSERKMSLPLDYPGLPMDASELPFIENIPGLSGENGLLIKKLQVEFTELHLTAGPIEGDTMPFRGVLVGKVIIETGDPLINIGINFTKPTLRLTFTSDVVKRS